MSVSFRSLLPFPSSLNVPIARRRSHPLRFPRLGYIGEFEIVDDHRGQKIVIELTGRLNKCGVISPRFDVGYDEIEKWIVNLLPSRQFGHIVISTTYGIMTHEEARRKKTGGKILGFFY
jgi:small subunit ribosomal protein S15Ae